MGCLLWSVHFMECSLCGVFTLLRVVTSGGYFGWLLRVVTSGGYFGCFFRMFFSDVFFGCFFRVFFFRVFCFGHGQTDFGHGLF